MTHLKTTHTVRKGLSSEHRASCQEVKAISVDKAASGLIYKQDV